jgi:hypothetical protein
MSLAGSQRAPRNQYGPLPGYRNPDGENMNKINLWGRPAPVAQMGRSPGLMQFTLRGCVLGAGQIRRMWRQAVNVIPASPSYSWSENAPQPGRPLTSNPGPQGVTRSLRYMTRSIYMGSGIDQTKFDPPLHTRIYPKVRSKPVTIGAGQVRSRPTVRNRITSFGQRVPTINTPVSGAENQ